MKQEIFKVKYESYTVVAYQDSCPITYPDSEKEPYEDYHGYLVSKKKKRDQQLFIEDYTSSVEEDYVYNYGNPLCMVLKTYTMVLVERTEDKVSIKVYDGYRRRNVGNTWFKTVRNLNFITVNLKTGDVYNGHLRNRQNKVKVYNKLRKNFFYNDPINELTFLIKGHIWSYSYNHLDVIKDAISKFMYEVDGREDSSDLSFDKRLFKFYLDNKGIKYPNNFHLYSTKLLGKEIRKILKKNDKRLVDTFMIHNGLAGKQLKKALHNCQRLNVDLYQIARKLFGDDWINQDDDFILNVLNSEYQIPEREIPAEFTNVIGKDELRRVFNLFKKVFFDNDLDMYNFVDHIRMYTELKMYGETDIKWMSNEVESNFFRDEHLDWTDKLSFYRKGYYQRIYPEFTYNHLEQPIGEYYPVVLNSSTNYNEESNIQSNCVKTYIGKSSNIIISLRKGSLESEDRATIEYRLYKEGDQVKCRRVQSLGKYNSVLSDQWISPLLKLDLKMLYYINHENFDTVKITKKCHNDTFLESDSYWDEDGIIRWVYKTIEGDTLIIHEWI
jgi:hypothetical protein